MLSASGELLGTSPTTVTLLTEDQRNSAVRGTRLTDLVQSLYSLVLFDTEAVSVLSVADTPDVKLDPAGRTNLAEYFFRVPPKVHEFTEPFATDIANTQYGGKVVESYGSIIKSIHLSGTTGLRPNKVHRAHSAVLPTGPDLSPAALGFLQAVDTVTRLSHSRTLDAQEATGHDDIIFLRNIFRHYSDLRRQDAMAGKVVMLWRNIKDADYWIVEPEEFRISQSAASPLTYEYNISLKTLADFSFQYLRTPDPLALARHASTAAARRAVHGRHLFDQFMVVSSYIEKVAGFGTHLMNSVLTPMLNVLNGANAIKNSSGHLLWDFRAKLDVLTSSLDEAITALQDISSLQDPLVHALRRARGVVDLMQADAAGYVNPAIQEWHSRHMRTYEQPGTGTNARVSAATGAWTAPPPASVTSSTTRPEEDIRDLAARTLGDREQWRFIAALNNLRYPYISALGGPGVLAPGDSVLLPTSRTRKSDVIATQTQSGTETDANPLANTPAQQSYGRDLRLQSSFVNGVELTDLVINQRGDLGSIQGVNNVEQAIRIKFATEQGELAAHPKFGAKFGIGRKATTASYNELRLNTLSTLRSDTRVDSVKSLEFTTTGDALNVSAQIALVNTLDTLVTNFALRRF